LNINWADDKNELLKSTRNISFEMVLKEIANGRILEDSPHPNHQKYPNQNIFVVKIDNYCYVVPYVYDEENIFLKTIIPSRKMMKKYKGV
jgi:hypothetical protein